MIIGVGLESRWGLLVHFFILSFFFFPFLSNLQMNNEQVKEMLRQRAEQASRRRSSTEGQDQPLDEEADRPGMQCLWCKCGYF